MLKGWVLSVCNQQGHIEVPVVCNFHSHWTDPIFHLAEVLCRRWSIRLLAPFFDFWFPLNPLLPRCFLMSAISLTLSLVFLFMPLFLPPNPYFSSLY